MSRPSSLGLSRAERGPVPGRPAHGVRNREEEVLRRRERIIDAASACVRKAGFHAASMAHIAKAAGLSVGQIYRDFDNKEAIIAALVERRVADLRETFAQLNSEPGDLLGAMIARLPQNIDHCLGEDRISLDLEILAEAVRNPRVGQIVRRAEANQMAIAVQLLSRLRKPDWSDQDFEVRAELLHVLFEGVQARAVRRPDLDRAALVHGFARLITETLD